MVDIDESWDVLRHNPKWKWGLLGSRVVRVTAKHK